MLVYSKQVFEVNFQIENTSIEGTYRYSVQTDNFVGYEYDSEVEMNNEISIIADGNIVSLNTDDIESVIESMDIDYAMDDTLIITTDDIAAYLEVDDVTLRYL